MAGRREAKVKLELARHMEEHPPAARVAEPPARKPRRRESCVLKPGTDAWRRLWPALTQPDPEDHAVPNEALPRRPRTRAECAGVPRPCPYVSCEFHRYLSVKGNGQIILNCPSVLPWEMKDSCLLDLIEERGELTLKDVGELYSVSKERIRQLEEENLGRLRATCLARGLTPEGLRGCGASFESFDLTGEDHG